MAKDPIWFDGQVMKIKKSIYQDWYSMTDFKNDDGFWFFLNSRELWYRDQPPHVQENWFAATDEYFKKNMSYQKRPSVKMADVKEKMKEIEATQDD